MVSLRSTIGYFLATRLAGLRFLCVHLRLRESFYRDANRGFFVEDLDFKDIYY